MNQAEHGPLSMNELRRDIRGRIILPEEVVYNKARELFYAWNDRRPALIVKAMDEKEVSRVVSFARDNDLELAIRSGGLSLAGHSMSEGGVVIRCFVASRADRDEQILERPGQSKSRSRDESAASNEET